MPAERACGPELSRGKMPRYVLRMSIRTWHHHVITEQDKQHLHACHAIGMTETSDEDPGGPPPDELGGVVLRADGYALQLPLQMALPLH